MSKDQAKIPFNKPFIVGKELYYVAQAVVAGHLSGDGPFSQRCHAWLENNLGCTKALLTHSCTAALEMAAILCDIGPGDEVIMPSFTFVSTANAFVLRGGTPVFVDIREDTLNLDEKLIEDAITDRTKVIVPVHYSGTSCAMEEIMAIAQRHNLLVVEDAAQALLSDYKEKNLGTIGHLGCLSFHETKNIISGEGGALLINDERFIDRAEIIREKGTDRNRFFRGEVDKYTWVDIGSSFLPSDMTAAFLLGQLEHAEEINAVRRRLCERYFAGLSEVAEKGCIRLPYVHGKSSFNGHLFYVVTRSAEERENLVRVLGDRGILAVSHYEPLHTAPAGKRYGRVGSSMAKTEDMSRRIVRLPLFYGLSEAEIDEVVETIVRFYGK